MNCNGAIYNLGTQECCDGNRIADIGQCNQPLCNGQPFDSNTSECCGNQVVPLGTCCNGTPFDSATQECCQNQVVTRGTCGGGGGGGGGDNDGDGIPDADDPDDDNDGYTDEQENNAGTNPRDASSVPGGGGGGGGLLECFDGPFSLGTYDPTTHHCCGIYGILPHSVPCPLWCEAGPRGGGGWVQQGQECCEGEVVPAGTCPQVLRCGEVEYNPNTQGCCDGVLFTIGSQECCNGTEIYDVQTQDCCSGGVYPKAVGELAVQLTKSCQSACVIAKGQSIEVYASAVNTQGDVTYEWEISPDTTASSTQGPGPITLTYHGDDAGGEFTLATVSVSDACGRVASTNVTVNVPKIIFTKASRDQDGNLVDSGVPVDYIPVWTPNDGVDKGPPILSSPTIDFQMSSPGVSLQVTFLGTNYVLARDATDPKLYTDASSGLTVRLNQEPLNDANAAEYLEATVSLPSADIADSLYACDETAANSSVFVHNAPGVISTIGSLNDTEADTVSIQLIQGSMANSPKMAETGANSLTFTNDTATVTARLVAVPTTDSPIIVQLSSADFSLSNTVLRLARYDGPVYRNFAPPIPTSLPPARVPDDATFYVEVVANSLGDLANQPISLKMDTDAGETQIGEVTLMPDSVNPGVLRSAKPVVLHDGNQAEIAASDRTVFQAIETPSDVKETADGVKITTHLDLPSGGAINSSTNVQQGGVVLEALHGILTRWLWQGMSCATDTEGKIRKPFDDMGYKMDPDYHATRNNVIERHAKKGKQIWYSLSHSVYGRNIGFKGLLFLGSDIKITGNDLQNKGLSFKLVIADGCVSAIAQDLNPLSSLQEGGGLWPACKELADAFGPNVAYFGWSTAQYGPEQLQPLTADLIQLLKRTSAGNRATSTGEAYNIFVQHHLSDLGGAYLKFYGNHNFKPNLRAER